jgi:invasion protein IalB
MVQALQVQNQAGQQAPFANLAIGRSGRGEPLKFVAQLPSNITIANGIALETKPDRPLAGAFTRCLPIGCFAEIVLPEDVRRRWMSRVENGIVTFHDGGNQQVQLPLSFRGFSAAMEAMLKEFP